MYQFENFRLKFFSCDFVYSYSLLEDSVPAVINAREGFPPLTLTWYDGDLMPPRSEEVPEDIKMGDTYGGALFVGTKGKILCGSHGTNGLCVWPAPSIVYTISPYIS